MMFQIMVNRVVERTRCCQAWRPEAKAAFDAALKRGPRPRRFLGSSFVCSHTALGTTTPVPLLAVGRP